MVAKKDKNAPKHPDIEGVPNLQVVEAAKVCKSNPRGYLSLIECEPHNKQVQNFIFNRLNSHDHALITIIRVPSRCTRSQGNNHCSFFVWELLISLCVLFGPL